jgi:hypothetical protein
MSVSSRVIGPVLGVVCLIACVAGALGHVHSSSAATASAIRYGYSDPQGADRSDAGETLILNTVASMVGNGGYIRAPLHWDPSQRTGPDFTRYDAFAAQAWNKGLIWLPMIVTNASGTPVTPQSTPPGIAGWQAGVAAIVAHYGPGGTFAQAHPGYPGLTAYEIWNEPNTATGNANPGCPTCQMDPATYDQILQTASSAIRGQASKMGFTPEVIGPALGAIDLNYLNSLYAADPSFLSYVDTFSVHLYMNSDPATCTTTVFPTAGHCVRTLATLRSWIDSHTPAGSPAPGIAITEGGYSGSGDSCRPPNVFSYTDQGNFMTTAYDWIRANPQLDVTLISPFQVIDNQTQTYTCGTGYAALYYQESLGAASPTGALRPGGTAYQALVADARTTPFLAWPNATVDRSSDDAGTVIVGHPTALPPITLSNTGQATLPITSFAFSGLAKNNYSLTTTCGSQLAAGQSCTVTPSLNATVTGSRPGTLTIVVNAIPSTFTVALTATATQGSLQFSPASLTFPTTTRKTTSAPLSTTVSNTGNAPVTLGGITLTGANAPMFAVSQSCPSVLAVGQSCTATITFTPSVTGAKSAKLTFKGDVPTGQQSAALAGTGN